MPRAFAGGSKIDPVKLAAAGQKFEYLSRQKGVFSKLTRETYTTYLGGEVEPIGDTNNPTLSGAVIETYSDLKSGGTRIDIPIIGRLSQAPFGDAEVQGLGESLGTTFRHMSVAMYRKPFRLKTDYEVQKVTNAFEAAVNNSNHALYTYYEEYMDGNIQHSLLTGFDVLLSTYRSITGQKSFGTPFSHPNFAVAGAGWVPGTAQTAAYETNLRGALTNLVGNVNAGMTVKRLRWLRTRAQRKNIKQMDTPWGKYTIVFMSDTQYEQLRTDPEYREDISAAYQAAKKDSPLISDATALIEGCLIYVVPGLFGVQSDLEAKTITTAASSFGFTGFADMPAYGPSGFWISENGTADGLDTNSIKCAMVLSPQALLKAYGKIKHEFKEQTWDSEHAKEVTHNSYCSLVRSDIFDDDGDYGTAGAFYLNNTSAVMATWSPLADMP
jgi:hypothetical protein